MTTAVRLDLHGCRVEFNSGSERLRRDIAEDFAYFRSGFEGAPEITVRADCRAVTGADLAGRKPLLKTDRLTILGSAAGTRAVWYPGGALSVYDYRAGLGTVICPDPELLWEISYLLLLSRAGEALERRGLHRLHAAAFSVGGRGVLLAGAPGAGKSTLLLQALRAGGGELLSDDTPLVGRDAVLKAFPLRLALAEGSPHLSGLPAGALRIFKRRHYRAKSLAGHGALGIGVCPAARAEYFFALKRGAARPRIKPLSPVLAAAELAKGLVAGYGVPQIAEYFLRLDPADLLRKAGLLQSRLTCAAALWKNCRFWSLELSGDTAANARLLMEFVARGG